jgi:hypothetical protein
VIGPNLLSFFRAKSLVYLPAAGCLLVCRDQNGRRERADSSLADRLETAGLTLRGPRPSRRVPSEL